MDTLPEHIDEFYVTAAEEFVKEFQDALDSLRTNLAIYIDPRSTSVLTDHPSPPSVFAPPTSDHEKLDQLGLRHVQQVAEVMHVLDYVVEDYLLRPGVCYVEEIESTLEQFVNRVQEATESYTMKSGVSPYENTNPHDDSQSMFHKFQQLHL